MVKDFLALLTSQVNENSKRKIHVYLYAFQQGMVKRIPFKISAFRKGMVKTLSSSKGNVYLYAFQQDMVNIHLSKYCLPEQTW
jgi:hypothetical protein